LTIGLPGGGLLATHFLKTSSASQACEEPVTRPRVVGLTKEIFTMINETNQNGNLRAQPVVAPRVDEALTAIESRPATNGPDVLAREELDALKAEVAQIKTSAVEVTSASGRLVRTGALALREDIEGRIRAKPLAALGIAALVGYVWGATR
jgi:hypothetical protein